MSPIIYYGFLWKYFCKCSNKNTKKKMAQCCILQAMKLVVHFKPCDHVWPVLSYHRAAKTAASRNWKRASPSAGKPFHILCWPMVPTSTLRNVASRDTATAGSGTKMELEIWCPDRYPANHHSFRRTCDQQNLQIYTRGKLTSRKWNQACLTGLQHIGTCIWRWLVNLSIDLMILKDCIAWCVLFSPQKCAILCSRRYLRSKGLQRPRARSQAHRKK